MKVMGLINDLSLAHEDTRLFVSGEVDWQYVECPCCDKGLIIKSCEYEAEVMDVETGVRHTTIYAEPFTPNYEVEEVAK